MKKLDLAFPMPDLPDGMLDIILDEARKYFCHEFVTDIGDDGMPAFYCSDTITDDVAASLAWAIRSFVGGFMFGLDRGRHAVQKMQ